MRGVGVALAAIGATVAADAAALVMRARVEIWGPWFGGLVGLLPVTGTLTVVTAALLGWA